MACSMVSFSFLPLPLSLSPTPTPPGTSFYLTPLQVNQMSSSKVEELDDLRASILGLRASMEGDCQFWHDKVSILRRCALDCLGLFVCFLVSTKCVKLNSVSKTSTTSSAHKLMIARIPSRNHIISLCTL